MENPPENSTHFKIVSLPEKSTHFEMGNLPENSRFKAGWSTKSNLVFLLPPNSFPRSSPFPTLFLPIGLGAPSSFFQPLIYLQTDVLDLSGRKSPQNIRRELNLADSKG